ncbi:hypothetical protein BDQ12DRAFT_683636 [Crucibulum laeve]|uniref:F-box domain-containing protein n=1 Tax=Crucibulum laeve TaxID=68775 RepID=A0A5C3LZP1_9AGAR|nr:hypothetical protein BDQ12DRAFT_683636 [Crucibulum laeve]
MAFPTFPPDILGEIFCFFVWTWKTKAELIPSPNHGPLLLCQICSTWRNIVLRMPDLWNALSIRAKNGHGISSDKLKELAKLWLQRGRSQPLTLDFHMPEFNIRAFDGYDARSNFVQEVLIAPLERVIDLNIHSRSKFELYPLFQHPANGVPQLETLVLIISHGCSSIEPVAVFAKAPKLRRVSIYTGFISNSLSQFMLPWKQLTHLYLGGQYLSLKIWLLFLRACTSFQVGIFYVYLIDAYTSNVMILPTITSLSLILQNTVFQADLSHLHLPALQNLVLGGPKEGFVVNRLQWNDTTRIFANQPQLRVLRLVQVLSIELSDLLSLLRATPSLVELELRVMTSFLELFDILQISIPEREDTTDPILPRLEVLIMDMPIYVPDKPWAVRTCQSFSVLVKSRWKIQENDLSLSKLRSAAFYGSYSCWDICLDEIKTSLCSCVEEGLDLKLGIMPDGNWHPLGDNGQIE